MAFDSNNNYSPPDVETRHVVVATKAFTDRATGHPNFSVTVPVGTVGKVVPALGHTQIGKVGPALSPETALIEHATANVGDVLTEKEVAAAVKTQASKLESVRASQEARRAETSKAKPAA